MVGNYQVSRTPKLLIYPVLRNSEKSFLINVRVAWFSEHSENYVHIQIIFINEVVN